MDSGRINIRTWSPFQCSHGTPYILKSNYKPIVQTVLCFGGTQEKANITDDLWIKVGSLPQLWGGHVQRRPVAWDINYESMTFPSLITPIPGGSGLWHEAPGGNFCLQSVEPGGLARLLSSTLACTAISVAGDFHLLWWRLCPKPRAAPLWALLIPLTFAKLPYPSFQLEITFSSLKKKTTGELFMTVTSK